MDDLAVPAGTAASTSLAARIPAQAVMAELLEVQRRSPGRGTAARFFGASPLGEQAAPWFRGALGEREVGRLLGKLPAGWHVLHAVPVGKGDSDIDHVVIGPGGVFTLNTKNHSGQKVWVAPRTFLVNGQKQPHVRNATHEAARAARLLSTAAGFPVPVSAVIVVVDPASLTVREKPADVMVLTSRRVVGWLKKRPQVLPPQQVEALRAVSERPGTWHVAPATAPDPTVLTSGFADLAGEVRSARRVRRVWGLTGAAAAGVTAFATGPALLEAFLSRLVA